MFTSKLLQIWQFIKNLKLRHIIIIGLILSLLFSFYQCHRNSELKKQIKEKEEKAERHYNNYKASKDSLKLFKNKFNDIIAEKRSFAFTIDELEESNKQLKNKYQKALGLNKDLRNTVSLLEQKIQINDSINTNVDNSGLNEDSTGNVTFNQYNDYGNGNTRLIKGKLRYRLFPDSLYFNNINIQTEQTINVKAGLLKKDDGSKYVRLTTSYPNTTIKNVENINIVNNKINNEKKTDNHNFSLGLHIGYGTYITSNNGLETGPVISAGLQWSPKFLTF